ncbi:MAG TPA: tripartite tricarboxylate transporter substrate binding protein [Xanthobacteraceae bacterium]|nr:tripartite tricarboxylate transporter substrate binding protein [Xanthobacteraceae bacterium]
MVGINGIGLHAAIAQNYPSRPIRLVVPYPSGGGTDIAARWIADKLGAQFDEKVFVDNRAGANGNLGTDYIAKAAPDGYTIGMATPGPVTVGRSLYADLPYDPKKDLVPIILANESPIVLVVNSKNSAKTLTQLIAQAKTGSGKLSAALVSIGSVPHLVTEMLKLSAGINLLEVPYKGGSPAMLDVMSGQVDMLFSVLPLVLPNIQSGQLRPLVIASKTRSSLIPDVRTTAEEGYGDVIGSAWNGIVAPTGTPKSIIEKLNHDTAQILATPETEKRFAELGMVAIGGNPNDFAQFMQAESEKWSKVISAAHLQPPD